MEGMVEGEKYSNTNSHQFSWSKQRRGPSLPPVVMGKCLHCSVYHKHHIVSLARVGVW